MRRARGALGLLCVLAVAPVAAGTVYRCDRADGIRSYSSKRVFGAQCKAIRSYPTGRTHGVAARAAVVAPAPAAMGGMVSASPVQGAPTQAAPAIPVSSARTPYQPPRLVRGQLYAYIKDGVRNYTSTAPRGRAGITAIRTIRYSFMESCYACAAKPGVDFTTLRLNTGAYQAEIASAAKDYGVDEAIVRAIIHAESAFNPNALSRVGAQGLMQLMPATARRFGVANAFDAAQNIRGGVQYLAFLLKRFNGDLTLAAAGYNAGEGAVDKYAGVPPYNETRRYVQRVGLLAQRYRGAPGSR